MPNAFSPVPAKFPTAVVLEKALQQAFVFQASPGTIGSLNEPIT